MDRADLAELQSGGTGEDEILEPQSSEHVGSTHSQAQFQDILALIDNYDEGGTALNESLLLGDVDTSSPPRSEPIEALSSSKRASSPSSQKASTVETESACCTFEESQVEGIAGTKSTDAVSDVTSALTTSSRKSDAITRRRRAKEFLKRERERQEKRGEALPRHRLYLPTRCMLRQEEFGVEEQEKEKRWWIRSAAHRRISRA